ncbi:MAG: hypothetical protein H6773_04480 [Pseudomonadales bacterium]|nr:hypothetical protein [Pseudomonadales bacterium]
MAWQMVFFAVQLPTDEEMETVGVNNIQNPFFIDIFFVVQATTQYLISFFLK